MGFEEAVSEALQRRTAEHAETTSTQARTPMSDAPINRPLNDPERWLLLHLAAQTIAAETGCDLGLAGDALRQAAEEDQLVIAGDALDVRVSVRGKVLVHCARDWLSFRASWPGEDPWQDRRWLT
jgi:hypothetical protein